MSYNIYTLFGTLEDKPKNKTDYQKGWDDGYTMCPPYIAIEMSDEYYAGYRDGLDKAEEEKVNE